MNNNDGDILLDGTYLRCIRMKSRNKNLRGAATRLRNDVRDVISFGLINTHQYTGYFGRFELLPAETTGAAL